MLHEPIFIIHYNILLIVKEEESYDLESELRSQGKDFEETD